VGRPAQVHVDGGVPFLERHQVELAEDRDAGVVEHEVESAVLRDHPIDRGLELLGRVTSTGIATALPPASVIAAATASMSVPGRSVTSTNVPAAAS
jgi:hypothetical protein